MSATPTSHIDSVLSVAWSPDGKLLAAGMENSTVQLWNRESHQFLKTLLHGHTDAVYDVAWLPNGQLLVSCARDMTIRLWNPLSGRQLHVLEGHTSSVYALDVSPDSHLLVSMEQNGTAHLWRCDTLEMVGTIESAARPWPVGPIFHPTLPLLAGPSKERHAISLWKLDSESLLSTHPDVSSVSYANAKVVIVGDSGVGKTGLSLVLSERQFSATDSTHSRHVRSLEYSEVVLGSGRKETREVFLWDLPGQPGYRLIQQLDLKDVSVAIIVFDARSYEIDPFAGVYHWERALRQAYLIQGDSAPPLKKILVAARVDRGGIGVSAQRIESFMSELSIDRYFAVSAKEGLNIHALREAIQVAIDWEALPRVSSSRLFQTIKDFLIAEKSSGRLLSTVEDLYDTFLQSTFTAEKKENLSVLFEACIGRIESAGLVRRLSFGDLVLLQPELLDAYASALVNAVKDEPEGLGCISEDQVCAGNFPIPVDERWKDRVQEKILLVAMIEDLLRRELVLREEAFLIFPSQVTRENPSLTNMKRNAIIFTFEGLVLNIYATLGVRLANSGLFRKRELWKNAITYTAKSGGICGVYLHNNGEGRGELTVFFDEISSDETRFHFVEYVQIHLQHHALPASVVRRHIFVCEGCGFVVSDQLISLRRSRGFNWVNCPGCDSRILLLGRNENLAMMFSSLIQKMNHMADTQRDREAARSMLQGKIEISDFDVFLCYNVDDRSAVREIGTKLKAQGILPWLDVWELRPGMPWQRLLEEQIEQIKSIAVFVGGSSIGPWQHLEIEAFLREFVRRGCPVIPVLLQEASAQPQLPLFMRGMTWVDFRKDDSDPLELLIWGITGKWPLEKVRRSRDLSEVLVQANEQEHSVVLVHEELGIKEEIAIKEEMEVRMDVSTIKFALGDPSYQEYEQLALAVIRRIGASDAEMITSQLVERGTVWEILLPSLGLRLETGKAIFFLRQKEWNRSSYKDLLAIQRAKKADFLLVVDFLDIGIAPPRVSSSIVWLRPEMLEEMITTSREEIVAWLGRLIASQVEHFVELIRYRAGGTLDPETDLFVGRGYELQRFGGGKARGGILVGAHASGKSSLFAQLSERLKEQQYTVGGPYGQTYFFR